MHTDGRAVFPTPTTANLMLMCIYWHAFFKIEFIRRLLASGACVARAFCTLSRNLNSIKKIQYVENARNSLWCLSATEFRFIFFQFSVWNVNGKYQIIFKGQCDQRWWYDHRTTHFSERIRFFARQLGFFNDFNDAQALNQTIGVSIRKAIKWCFLWDRSTENFIACISSRTML